MKKRTRTWAAIAVLTLLPLGVVVASSAEPVYTVGDFAVHLVKMITLKAEVGSEDAAAFLGKLGVEMQGELDSQVSEQALVDAFDRLGVTLMTSNPEQTVTAQRADHLFQMFDPNDQLFSFELFFLCKGGGAHQNRPCVTHADCGSGFCQLLQSVRCQEGPADGELCMTNAECPGGVCNIPPGQFKKLNPASPDGSDG